MEWSRNNDTTKYTVKEDDVMNPIELGKAIADVGIPVITAVMLILVVGLVWYLIKRQSKREDKHDEERTKRQDKRDRDQKEERDYYRTLITNDQKKNVDLNIQGITMQKEMMKDFKGHNIQSRKAWKKIIESLTGVSNRLNGNNPKGKDDKNEKKK